MNNNRAACPVCGEIMYFLWPSPQSDPVVEREIGRFQRCMHYGHFCGDTNTNRQLIVHRLLLEPGYIINGKKYLSLRTMLKELFGIDD